MTHKYNENYTLHKRNSDTRTQSQSSVGCRRTAGTCEGVVYIS